MEAYAIPTHLSHTDHTVEGWMLRVNSFKLHAHFEAIFTCGKRLQNRNITQLVTRNRNEKMSFPLKFILTLEPFYPWKKAANRKYHTGKDQLICHTRMISALLMNITIVFFK